MKEFVISEVKAETAVLVGLITQTQDEAKTKEYLDELEFLADTAGAVTVKRFTQKVGGPNSVTYVGTGKLEEIKQYIRDEEDAERPVGMVIFDDELSAKQIRNIEASLGVKILDRTSLILDIFAMRAQTANAKTQVELAQYRYMLPRLQRLWTHLERQGGGSGSGGGKGSVGLRGPGETQLEMDRRIILNRMSLLKQRLTEIDKQKATQRKNRGRMIRVALVGYTNVGKSTLINQLLAHYGGEGQIITTSNHPGTTLDMIHIPLTPEHAIIDTPGIIHRTQLAHYLSREAMRKLLPSKPFKPMTFQLNAGQTIFLAGVGRVDFEKGERTSFTYYVSKDCYLHRTKLDKADAFYAQHKGGLLSPPSEDEATDFPDLVAKELTLSQDQDVAISGLGWFSVNRPVRVTVWVPKGVAVTVRDAII